MSESVATTSIQKATTQKATFAAGCFWGVEDAFRKVPGVFDAISGYIGGHRDHPTYREVCSGTTNHAEAVEVTFDTSQVSYEQLVEIFFRLHDPTQMNRQGPDVGTQYRSAIFVHDEEQKKIACGFIEKLESSGKYSRPIATKVEDASTFWAAEEYHQKYFEKHGGHSCHIF
jgi:peptide-methionine (S)-S-oxide reductase